MAVNRDVTDFRKTDEALRESEARFRSLIEGAPEAIGMSRKGLTTYGNPRFLRMFGYSSVRELYGRPIIEQIAPEDRERVMESVRSHERGQWDQQEIEFYGVRMDGTQFPIHISTTSVNLPDGPAVLGFFTDITERRKVEDELRRSNAELQQFAYVASHDLQEPLRMIVSYLSLLDERYKDQLNPTAQEYIRYAVDGGERMRALIDDLLAYSRIETKGKTFAPVDMNEVMDSALAILRASIEENQAEIVVKPLPTILADKSQMKQVMQNLVANAIKFRGMATPQIHVSVRDRGNEWVFSVRDNGIGIEPNQQSRIFQMFQRLHTREEYPGTGIGLAIAKKIIERHGGRIWFESDGKNGSTFYFTIPFRTRNGGYNE